MPTQTTLEEGTTLDCSGIRTHEQHSGQPFQQIPATTGTDRRQGDRHRDTMGGQQETLAQYVLRRSGQEGNPTQGMDLF